MNERRAGQIRIERGASKKHYSVIMTAPDGSVASVVVERRGRNSAPAIATRMSGEIWLTEGLWTFCVSPG